MINTGRATLMLDEVLSKMTPEQAEAFRAFVPVGMRDQVDAATEETWEVFQTAHATGLTRPASASEHPDWVRLGIAETLVTWWAGTHKTCIHDPHPARPQPMHAAAWKPGYVVCRQCTHLLEIPRSSPTSLTCDGCGRLTTGTDTDNPMYPFLVFAGLLTFSVGVCEDCRYFEKP